MPKGLRARHAVPLQLNRQSEETFGNRSRNLENGNPEKIKKINVVDLPTSKASQQFQTVVDMIALLQGALGGGNSGIR
jgi:hypothetical protein